MHCSSQCTIYRLTAALASVGAPASGAKCERGGRVRARAGTCLWLDQLLSEGVLQ